MCRLCSMKLCISITSFDVLVDFYDLLLTVYHFALNICRVLIYIFVRWYDFNLFLIKFIQFSTFWETVLLLYLTRLYRYPSQQNMVRHFKGIFSDSLEQLLLHFHSLSKAKVKGILLHIVRIYYPLKKQKMSKILSVNKVGNKKGVKNI